MGRRAKKGRFGMGRSSWVALTVGLVAGILPGAAAAAPLPGPAANAPVEGRLHTGRAAATSTNWSGYATLGTMFTSASGSWTQPPAECGSISPKRYSIAAFWVGLDGYESNTVEQTGTESDCSGPKPVYRAWYELYPERSFLLEGRVEAGDELRAEVTQDTLKLEDATQKWTAEEHFLPGKLEFSSAEWIAEAAKDRLTPFGSVQFHDAAASTTAVANGPINDEAWSNEAITLVDKRGTVLAEPGSLEANGTAFTITAAPGEQPPKGKGKGHGNPH
jgi:hypothetical protein